MPPETKQKPISTIPDGVYNGLQSAYTVRFRASGQNFEILNNIGLRGINRPVTVIVVDGRASVLVNQKKHEQP